MSHKYVLKLNKRTSIHIDNIKESVCDYKMIVFSKYIYYTVSKNIIFSNFVCAVGLSWLISGTAESDYCIGYFLSKD